MDDDWDAEDFVPPPPSLTKEQPKGQWDDEDAPEDEDVKESWEDEDKPKPVEAPVPAPVTPKTEKKRSTEVKDNKRIPPANEVASTVEERVAKQLEEKLRQQRLVEEADYQATTELFKSKDGDKYLDSFIPKSESDFSEYGELIAKKLRPFEKSFHYLTLLKAVMRHAMLNLKASDAKEVASSVTVIANEKLKAEKEAAGKKKTGPKKKQLHMDKADEDAVSNVYDDVDDYDFM